MDTQQGAEHGTRRMAEAQLLIAETEQVKTELLGLAEKLEIYVADLRARVRQLEIAQQGEQGGSADG